MLPQLGERRVNRPGVLDQPLIEDQHGLSGTECAAGTRVLEVCEVIDIRAEEVQRDRRDALGLEQGGRSGSPRTV